MFRNPPSLATILLIVNDDGRRSMLRQQLEALGYSVWPVTDQQPLAHLLQLGRCDLLVVDTDSSPNTPAVVAEISAVVAQGTPILRLASSTQFTPGWHEDSLGVRVANALRKRNADQLVSERLQRWQSMDVLDEESLLFRQAFIEAQLPGELERARRGYQPLTLVMMEVQNPPLPLPPDYWRSIGVHVLAGVRQIDLAARYHEAGVLVLLPFTEPQHAALIARRIERGLRLLALEPALTLAAGVAAYPSHGETIPALLSAAQRALTYAVEPTTSSCSIRFSLS